MSDTEDYDALRERNIAERNKLLAEYLNTIKNDTDEINKLEESRLGLHKKEENKKKRKANTKVAKEKFPSHEEQPSRRCMPKRRAKVIKEDVEDNHSSVMTRTKTKQIKELQAEIPGVHMTRNRKKFIDTGVSTVKSYKFTYEDDSNSSTDGESQGDLTEYECSDEGSDYEAKDDTDEEEVLPKKIRLFCPDDTNTISSADEVSMVAEQNGESTNEA